MNIYRIRANVTKVFSANQDVTFVVEAESEDGARKIAYREAEGHADIGVRDALEDSTDVNIYDVEFIEGDDLSIPRCDKTQDLFAQGGTDGKKS